jgi:hypothetical protein
VVKLKSAEDDYIAAINEADEVRRRILFREEQGLPALESLEKKLARVERDVEKHHCRVLAQRAKARTKTRRSGFHQPTGRLKGAPATPRRKELEEAAMRPVHRVRPGD